MPLLPSEMCYSDRTQHWYECFWSAHGEEWMQEYYEEHPEEAQQKLLSLLNALTDKELVERKTSIVKDLAILYAEEQENNYLTRANDPLTP